MAEQQTVIFYREADADPDALSGQTVTVVGYGNLGRSMALNLRDSGLAVSVGNADDSYRPTALADGFAVAGIAEAVATADVVFVLIPDEVIPEVFGEQIGPSLRPGTCVCFASGYVLALCLGGAGRHRQGQDEAARPRPRGGVAALRRHGADRPAGGAPRPVR